MAGSIGVPRCFSTFSPHTVLKTYTLHQSSSTNSPESFLQAHEKLSASMIGYRDTRVVFRTCNFLRKPVFCKCATACAILERDGNLPSLYNLLGLDQHVTLPEIKTAYRQMARQYHPDVCPCEEVEECTRKFVQVQDAYDTLSDPERRAEYDFKLSCSRSGGNGGWKFQQHGASRFSRSTSDRGGWRSKWEQQLEILLQGNATDRSSKSWGARMRRSKSNSQM